jgi:polysaccharide pyruvyl transferase WcaK-like protein
MGQGSPTVANHLSTRGKIHRVGLISPCSGNLGNAAIMSSMIANIQLRVPGVEVMGFTLGPEDTTLRHGIASFPITGTSHGMYQLADDAAPFRGGWKEVQPESYVKKTLKRIGWLRSLVQRARTVRLELVHIMRAGRLVGTMDRVVVSGGGALDDYWGGPWGHPWTLFKFAVLSRICGVPYLFVSVGMCGLRHRLSRVFVGCALSLAQYRSYRDNVSNADMKAMFPRLSGVVWPDLAYGYSCPKLPPQRNNASHGGPLIIAVSPIAFRDPRVWPVKDVQRYTRYFNELTKFLKRTINDGNKLILFATDGGDLNTINDLREILLAESTDADAVQVLPCPPEQTTEKLLQRIGCADLVIASRLHGVILSHLIAKPVLAISYDRKVDVHMREIGQSKYCMNIDEVTAETIAEQLAVLSDARELESTELKRAVQLNREQASAQYDLLFGTRPSDSETEDKTDLTLTQVRR